MLSKSSYKRKRKEDQEAAAHVFKDFLETFQNPTASIANKTFVRSGILYQNNEEQTENIGQIYKPKPLIVQTKSEEARTAIECAKILKEAALSKAKKQEKPKSNLDLLKEELKLRHSERGEKERLKEEYDLSPTLITTESDDTNSTNLFVANLSSKITENHLMLEFGEYGPLASVKILWPRADECQRNSNCGFVAFMSRKDAERALKKNQHRDDMRICWGKTVEIPSHPIYIPNSLLKLYLPPPLSGLPFNAQVPNSTNQIETETDFENFDEFLQKCVIKVTIPLNKKVLTLVHRMVEFVVREGPMFEAFIMNREINNPEYNFLFDCQSPIHVYYRWKLFSILNGESQKSWSMEKFRMFKGGSIWCPPRAPCYTAGMPDELISSEVDRKKLSDAQSTRLISLIQILTIHRSKIAEAMLFCLNHNNAIDDSIEIILESLMNPHTPAYNRIARLYLLSDVLSNCKSKKIKLQIEENESTLLEVFRFIRNCSDDLKNLSDRDNFNSRVIRIFRHWDIHKIFTIDFLENISSLFSTIKPRDEDDTSSIDEPLDGANLLKRSLGDSVDPNVVTAENLNAKKVNELSEKDITKYFVPSKWDTIDPEEVEAQAMSTEKMYIMELEKDVKKSKDKKKKKKLKR
ncbi:unnamed protein product [Psylliodes chrysocephalus]|uniref:Uncharacterized protein n=1 Tax=Psylliodes chrysocephalus TaxID=3402493 RepID=A0A9P0DC20_9CUCU|nr:unnamed protein product [Psylliodes chrysocephala]